KHAGDPRAAIVTVDAEHVGLVHTEPGRGDRVNAVAVPQMSKQPFGDWLVVHSRAETLEIGQCFGVALPGFLGVPPDDFLETGVLGHGQALPDTPSSPSDAAKGRWPVTVATE